MESLWEIGARPAPDRPGGVPSVLALLEEAQDRTDRLIEPISDDDYTTVHHPVMGPVAWDVGHIVQQADLWLVQTLGRAEETLAGSNETYDAYRNPRPTRVDLPLLSKGQVRHYREQVLEHARDLLRAGPSHPNDPDDPLWHDLYVAKMVIQHEHQHNETILQHLQTFPAGRYRAPDRVAAPTPMSRVDADAFVRLDRVRCRMGVPPHTAWTYDNEWARHEVDVPALWVQTTPVTNGQYLRFVQAGGYEEPAYWDDRGFRKIVEEGGAVAPSYWRKRGGRWTLHEMGAETPLPLDRPVCHVSWYEADAFARWTGHRLPTEAEWERVAGWDETGHRQRSWPWGETSPTRRHANLDQRRYATDPVGSHPEGATPHGVHQLVGDVWEWTASPFRPYPDYTAFPYREYSEMFFDKDLKVLRGGSWATRPSLRLNTFRNWDLPERRQIFAGLRLVSDAPPDRPPRVISR